jgi:hypothetical protein
MSAAGNNRFSSVLFSGDGQWMAGLEETPPTINAFGTIKILDLATRTVITNLGPLPGHSWRLALSADENVLSANSRTAFSTNRPSNPMPGRPYINATYSWEAPSWSFATNHPQGLFLDTPALPTASNALASTQSGPLSPMQGPLAARLFKWRLLQTAAHCSGPWTIPCTRGVALNRDAACKVFRSSSVSLCVNRLFGPKLRHSSWHALSHLNNRMRKSISFRRL